MDVENRGGCDASCFLVLPSHYAWFLFFLMLIKKNHWRNSDSFAEMPRARMPKGRFANTAPFPHRGPCEKKAACYQNVALPFGRDRSQS